MSSNQRALRTLLFEITGHPMPIAGAGGLRDNRGRGRDGGGTAQAARHHARVVLDVDEQLDQLRHPDGEEDGEERPGEPVACESPLMHLSGHQPHARHRE